MYKIGWTERIGARYGAQAGEKNVIKAAFFDIDGTLLNQSTGNLIPQSTKDALVELRRRGVRCIICSGRPKVQLPWCIRDGFPSFDDGFDSYITMTGSLCYDKDGVYADTPLDQHVSERMVALYDRGDFDILVLNREGSYASGHGERMRELERMVAFEYPEADPHELLKKPVYQFCAFVPREEDDALRAALPDTIITRWCDVFCDIVPANSSKPAGIKAALAHYGISQDETIAFGDGANDATMLEFCHIGVAMGNGNPEAKEAADYVTDDVDKDGIAKALLHFGLIG